MKKLTILTALICITFYAKGQQKEVKLMPINANSSYAPWYRFDTLQCYFKEIIGIENNTPVCKWHNGYKIVRSGIAFVDEGLKNYQYLYADKTKAINPIMESYVNYNQK